MNWFLINASPDLRSQIDAFPALHAAPDSIRNSPIRAVLLTNADLDHVLGLFLLREGEPLHVHAPLEVRVAVSSSLGMTKVLASFHGVTWHEPPLSFSPLLFPNGNHSGLSYRSISLPGHPPRWADQRMLGVEGHSVAYEIKDDSTGAMLLVAPDVAALTWELQDSISRADAILFDGTFWQAHEMDQIHSGARTAAQMGHLPISEGSLDALSTARAKHRIYLHINNTNPMLAAASAERAQVEKAGVTVGTDGLEFQI